MIALLATGGTIAGVSRRGEYKAGVLGVCELLERANDALSVDLRDKFKLKAEQIANIDSCDMTDALWLRLAKRCAELAPKTQGIVITHGTDTMEETAFFLSLVLQSPKPVVLTGAMRAQNAARWDGAQNLYNALLLASCNSARGVFVAMNGRIFAPKAVQKTHATRLNAFKFGELGRIVGGKISIQSKNLPQNSLKFDISRLKTLPKVDILYSYSNDGSSVAANALFESGTKGLVIAGSGAGSIHTAHKEALKGLLKKGLKVVVSSRCGGVALRREDSELGFISAGRLNPQKARILLMLALTKTNDNGKIAEIFAKI